MSFVYFAGAIVGTVTGESVEFRAICSHGIFSIFMRVNAHSHKNLWIKHYNKWTEWASFIRLWQFAWVQLLFLLHCYNHRPFKWPGYYRNAAALHIKVSGFCLFSPMELLFIFQSTIEITLRTHTATTEPAVDQCWCLYVGFSALHFWFNSK